MKGLGEAKFTAHAVYGPFDDETQAKLHEWDNLCRGQHIILEDAMKKASLAGEDYKMTIDDMIWFKGITAFGILMNRAIDAGWVTGIMTEEK